MRLLLLYKPPLVVISLFLSLPTDPFNQRNPATSNLHPHQIVSWSQQHANCRRGSLPRQTQQGEQNGFVMLPGWEIREKKCGLQRAIHGSGLYQFTASYAGEPLLQTGGSEIIVTQAFRVANKTHGSSRPCHGLARRQAIYGLGRRRKAGRVHARVMTAALRVKC